ncbi:MAG: pyridoxal-phosphate dependent enzyme [Legionellales bacterium]|nr:pyridoxal-phosphate dependent enzyme [Legionellales bacterium]
MKIYQNTLDMIGNTPILKLNQLNTGCCELFLKLEYYNPGGSIKDRIALRMIEKAEQSGALKTGGTIIEATAGNTGLGLALVARLKGYKLLIVMPDKMGKEKIIHLRAMGAEVITTRSDVEKGHPDYYQDLAASIAARTPNSFYINQFANPENPLTHEESTAPELWKQLDHRVDAVVYGMGSTGTFTGIARFLKKHAPKAEMILADPEGSVLASLVNSGIASQPGRWLVEGIGEDFVPDICDLNLVTKAYTITDRESFLAGRELLSLEGVLAGSSTGTHLAAALKYCREQTKPKRVVTFACDTGNKYLSKMFDDEWLWNQGFIERDSYGDLRDIIARPYHKHATTTIGPEEPILTAHKHMMTYGISQLPIMDNKNFLGLICEADILQAVYSGHPFSTPAKEIMMRDFGIAPHTTSIDVLLPMFNHYQAIVIMDNHQFLGLITAIDLINHLRRQQLIGNTHE